jgi:hypothetical protein
MSGVGGQQTDTQGSGSAQDGNLGGKEESNDQPAGCLVSRGWPMVRWRNTFSTKECPYSVIRAVSIPGDLMGDVLIYRNIQEQVSQ